MTPAFELVDTDRTDTRFQDALSSLFFGDGTIYLVSGYFTYQGYLAIRDDIISFLARSPENELVAIVGPTSDQFSPQIATDLWSLNDDGQICLLKKPRGLHAKLYFREGPNPRCIIGSANITRVAFEYNTEVSVELNWDTPDHPGVAQFRGWIDDLLADSERLKRRDLFAPMLIGGAMINWSNKVRILPARKVVLRAIPVVLLLVLFGGLFRVI